MHRSRISKVGDDVVLTPALATLGGTTGVRDTLDAAVRLQQPVVVYVVLPPLTSSSAFTLGPSDVVALLFRSGVTPGDVYRYLHRSDVSHADPRMHLPGDFIRAEAVVLDGSSSGDDGAGAGAGAGGGCKRIVLKKDEPLEESHRVIKLFANKAKAWQTSGSGSGGGGGGGSGGGLSKQNQGMTQSKAGNEGKNARQLSLERMLKRLHKSSDRQGKSKGGKGTGQDRRTVEKNP